MKGSSDERERAERNTIAKNYLVIFDVCFYMVLVKIRKKDVFKGGSATCGLEKF